MEAYKTPTKSIWGKWWEPIRKWFYPIWLCYELTYRFYDYAADTYHYVSEHSSHALAVASAIIVFIICTVFLTVSTCYILHSFFKYENLTATFFEARVKKYF